MGEGKVFKAYIEDIICETVDWIRLMGEQRVITLQLSWTVEVIVVSSRTCAFV
jgi:hypothetical protein